MPYSIQVNKVHTPPGIKFYIRDGAGIVDAVGG